MDEKDSPRPTQHDVELGEVDEEAGGGKGQDHGEGDDKEEDGVWGAAAKHGVLLVAVAVQAEGQGAAVGAVGYQHIDAGGSDQQCHERAAEDAGEEEAVGAGADAVAQPDAVMIKADAAAVADGAVLRGRMHLGLAEIALAVFNDVPPLGAVQRRRWRRGQSLLPAALAAEVGVGRVEAGAQQDHGNKQAVDRPPNNVQRELGGIWQQRHDDAKVRYW